MSLRGCKVGEQVWIEGLSMGQELHRGKILAKGKGYDRDTGESFEKFEVDQKGWWIDENGHPLTPPVMYKVSRITDKEEDMPCYDPRDQPGSWANYQEEKADEQYKRAERLLRELRKRDAQMCAIITECMNTFVNVEDFLEDAETNGKVKGIIKWYKKHFKDDAGRIDDRITDATEGMSEHEIQLFKQRVQNL